MRDILLLFCVFFQMACNPEAAPSPLPQSPSPEQLSILALGDSYTMGEGIGTGQSFPAQLRDSLIKRGEAVQGLRIVAKTGWRSDNLVTALNNNSNQDIRDSVFGIVSLCIGVNDQYQNKSVASYKPIFEQLLQKAIAQAGGKNARVFVLSIPDWFYTPYGQNYPAPAGKISTEIDAFNAENKQISESYGVTYINVTEISRRGLAQPILVAGDGLHPSAQQYSEWVGLLLPKVLNSLEK
jgi:lysophospholipase L1-like esterase